MAETKLPKTVKIMVDGEKTDALVRVDGNGEYALYTKPDSRNPKGRVFFFPGDSDLLEEVRQHNEANKAKPVFAEDVEDTTDHELEAWLASGPSDDKEMETIGASDVGSVESVLGGLLT